MAILLNTHCPFPGNTFCDTDCMLSFVRVESDTECEETNNDGIACAFAVLVSQVGGGDWFAKCVTYRGDAE